MSTHEDFSRADTVSGGSNRSFGLVFAAVFLLAAFGPLLRGHPVRWWAAGVSVVFALLAVCRPGVLAPLNRVWIRLGHILHRVVSPLVLGAVFFLAVTPIGMLMRLFKGGSLLASTDAKAASYWIARQPPWPDGESLKHQF